MKYSQLAAFCLIYISGWGIKGNPASLDDVDVGKNCIYSL